MAIATETRGHSEKTDNTARDRSGREMLRSYAPATGALLGEVPVATTEDVRRVVASARRAQEAWALLPIAERAERILRYRNALVERAEELIDIEVRETGKTRHEALISEVYVVVETATYFAKNAERLLAPKKIEMVRMKHRKSYLHYVPRGVIAVISPWNFPVVLTMSDALTALIAGNAVVCKPSEVTPLSVQKCKEIWDATGLPPDLFQIVHGYGKTGADLIDAGVNKVIFTGGVATGKRVAAMCGERLIPCTLELGGKAPLIACEDADIERTARAIVWGGFANSGQICVSVERVYAHEQVHDRLLERVVGLVSELRQGDTSRGDVDVGAMTFPKQIDVVEAHVKDAVSKGAALRSGGKRKPGPGTFFEPTVLANCTHDMTVMKEEIFGPIVPFMKVESDEEAIAHANDTHLGLNAYVFTKDREKGCRIAERVDAGSVIVNDVLINYAYVETPFGGVKQSGLGRVHGEDALRDMCETRHINVDRFGSLQREVFWYPYTPDTLKWFTKATRMLFGAGGVVRKLTELL